MQPLNKYNPYKILIIQTNQYKVLITSIHPYKMLIIITSIQGYLNLNELVTICQQITYFSNLTENKTRLK